LCFAGNEPEPSDIATPKLAPATPSSTPIASSASKLCTKKNASSIAAEIRLISTSVARLRPMYCDSTPSGKRNSAPAMIGIDSIRPFCAGLRWKVSLMKGAIAPFSTHVQHENAKYRKAANSVGAWPVARNFLKWIMAASSGVGCKGSGRAGANTPAGRWTKGGGLQLARALWRAGRQRWNR